jgi:hypothetical protein
MKNFNLIAAALDPSLLLKARGIEADPWQRDLLFSEDRQVLLNCCRQAGKSTVVSALALHTALYTPGSLTVILSPVQRQSTVPLRPSMKLSSNCNSPTAAA